MKMKRNGMTSFLEFMEKISLIVAKLLCFANHKGDVN